MIDNNLISGDSLCIEINSIVDEHPGLCVQDICRHLKDVPESTIRYRVKLLHFAGLIRLERTRKHIFCYPVKKVSA